MKLNSRVYLHTLVRFLTVSIASPSWFPSVSLAQPLPGRPDEFSFCLFHVSSRFIPFSGFSSLVRFYFYIFHLRFFFPLLFPGSAIFAYLTATSVGQTGSPPFAVPRPLGKEPRSSTLGHGGARMPGRRGGRGFRWVFVWVAYARRTRNEDTEDPDAFKRAIASKDAWLRTQCSPQPYSLRIYIFFCFFLFIFHHSTFVSPARRISAPVVWR